MKHYAALVLFLLFSQNILAQIDIYPTQHRPYGLNWQILKTDHFRIIFPEGEESSAYKTAKILEQYYPNASKVTGGTLKNFPVVITNYNDNANGFVTSNNFRSEFDLSPIIGKSLNPKSGHWLETVLPHELLHATHININPKYSIGNIVRLFSPDAARSLNFTPPVGLHEGLAVWFESTYTKPGAGRLNSTLFNNQFNANFGSGKPWSMSQIFQPSENTRPYNRHYIAGASFVDWLGSKYGEDIYRKSVEFNYKYFFLGYGFALRWETKKWPGQLHKEFLQDIARKEQLRINNISNSTNSLHKEIKIPYKGLKLQKPLWINNNELVYYGQHYNKPQGFYKHNLETNKLDFIKETTASSDFIFSYDKNNGLLYFSGYRTNLLYDNVYTLDIKQLDLKTGKIEYLSEKQRIYSPAKTKDGFVALQTNKNSADIVFLKDGTPEILKTFEDDIPVSLVSNPKNRDEIAAVVNKNGYQALWITDLEHLKTDLDKNPTLALKIGSIFDIDWHPTQNKLLFTTDLYPAMNIYEYDIDNDRITQLTNSVYNVMEGNYSPDGNAIIYSYQLNNEQSIAILDKNDFYNRILDDNELLEVIPNKETYPSAENGAEINTDNWKIEDYKTDLSWLKPRSILPTLKENHGLNQFGMAMLGTDVLGSHSYFAEVSRLQNKFWYDVQYSNNAFFPGFKMGAYSSPSFSYFDTDWNNDGLNDITGTNRFEKMTLLSSESGFSFSVPLKFNARKITRTSAFLLTPRLEIDRLKYLDLNLKPISDNAATQYKLGYSAQFNWRILRLARDIQPRSGLVLFSTFKRVLNSTSMDLTFKQTGNKYRLSLNEKWGHHFGAFGYLAPLGKYNQSLRLDIHFLAQSSNLLYNTDSIRPMGFKGHVFPNSPLLARLSAKYTIPLFYPDNGSLLVPVHFNTLYLSTFAHTIGTVDEQRTIIGGGLHFRYNFGNIALNFGIGVGFEPARNQLQFIYGDF